MDRRQFLAAGAAALAAPAIIRPASAQTTTLRLHHFLPAGSTFQQQVAEPWARDLAAATNGALRVEMFPSMTLGGAPPALYDQARDGVVDLIWTLPGNTPGRFPVVEVFELPFMAGSATTNSLAMAEFGEKHLRQEFRDTHVIGWWAHDPGLIHTVNRPVTRLEDLQGLKLRFPTRQTGRALEALGASTVGMPLPQAPEALQRGTVDGLVVPWEVVPSLRIQELTKFHTAVPGVPSLYTATFVLAMNRRRYTDLPAELKRVLDQHSGMAWSRRAGMAWDAAAANGLASARARNNTIQSLSTAEVARWRDRTASVSRQWLADVRGRGHNGDQLLAEAQSLIQKHSRPA